ncbi:MAG TPA: hypothetical protein VN374_03385, partial [Desulfitobacteriaceae bacterium]|nr:hypothetical protein [Desulfitobacteriaceae bacterium]
MKQILDIYHFSEEEKKDFLEFWTNKLDKSKNYIFYNEDTKIVDEAMPLQVKPLPGRSYRIWFYIIEADGDSRDLENPDPVSLDVIPANRCDKGDILVEVGGVM